MMRFVTRACLPLFLITPLFAATPPADSSAWPDVTAEARPWTRWWWPGSAVTDADITDELEAFARVGIGGVEITPVYGAKGYESRWLDHLSPEWLDRLGHTLREAKRLGLGVDLAGGTGWNFGGPTVGDADAAKHVVFRRFSVRAGEQLDEPVSAEQQPWVRFVLNQVYTVAPGVSEHDSIPTTREEPELVSAIPVPDVSQIREPLQANPNLQQLAIDQIKFHRHLPLEALMAYGPGGEVLNLTERVGTDGQLAWTAPTGTDEWTLYAVFQAWNGKLVERAGPGGEGFMIDHFSPHAITHYLEHLDNAFDGRDLTHLRAFFNDSYEVDDARYASDWTDDLFSEFRRRRGYDLRSELPALFANDGSETHIRVLTDYRETLSDLLLDRFTLHWSGWSAERGKQIRNQAHGSPANILDLYAASDIPETEGISLPHIKFASSAAHVSGRPLVSAEAVTFLNENFRSTPAQIRDNLRRYWLGGVNHVVYHGTAFSPGDEAWPGWFFYVATHLNPRNSIWEHTSAVHGYATRVQSFLQAGRPDNDVLLYWPIHDRYAEPSERDLADYEGDGPRRRLVTHFRTDGNDFETTAFGRTASHLINHGYAVDYISDRQLQTVEVDDGRLMTGDANYQTIILPRTRYLPPGSFARLLDLAEAGATVLIDGELPADVPGRSDVDARRKQLRDMTTRLSFQATSTSGVRRASLGEGAVLLGENLEALLAAADVRREPLSDQGLQTIRRRIDGDTIYYIVNTGANAIDGWIQLGTPGASAMQLNPENGDTSPAALRTAETNLPEVYLQLEPGSSRILRLSDERVYAPAVAKRAAGPSLSIDSPWQLTFLTGGPVLPKPATIASPGSWTTLDDPETKRFAGTARYATRFTLPDTGAAGWWIDLGAVAETAEVRLNGQSLGIHIGPAYRVFVPAQALRADNLLEIDVANLAANRIADLDRRGVAWRKMYNNNIRPLRAENRDANGMFTAAQWEPVASGLLGPVTVTPVEFFEPAGMTNPGRQTSEP